MDHRLHMAALACAVACTVAVRGNTIPATSPASAGGERMHARAIHVPAGAPQSARVAGTIRTHDGRQLVNGAVLLTPIDNEGSADVSIRDATILPDGAFAFYNVPRGEYQIRARGNVETNGITRFATFRVLVERADIDRIDLTLTPGAMIHGRIVIERTGRARPPAWNDLRVRAPLVDGTNFGDTLDGQVLRDGTWGIHGAMAGRHVFTVEGLPYPWVLKAVRWRGQDITDTGIDAGSRREYADVRVTIADVASEISGVVRGANGAAVADALVVVAAVDTQYWTKASRRFVVTRSNAEGRFRVRGLPAGEYRAAASLEISETQAYRPATTTRLIQSGAKVSLAHNGTVTLDLPLSSAAVPTGTASR